MSPLQVYPGGGDSRQRDTVWAVHQGEGKGRRQAGLASAGMYSGCTSFLCHHVIHAVSLPPLWASLGLHSCLARARTHATSRSTHTNH